MNNEQQDKALEGIQEDVREIKEALLGTYEKKGIITRLRGVERTLSTQWWVASIIIVALVGSLARIYIG